MKIRFNLYQVLLDGYVDDELLEPCPGEPAGHWERFRQNGGRLHHTKVSPAVFRTNSSKLKYIFTLKTVSVISSDNPCKNGNARFTTVPIKSLSDQPWTRAL